MCSAPLRAEKTTEYPVEGAGRGRSRGAEGEARKNSQAKGPALDETLESSQPFGGRTEEVNLSGKRTHVGRTSGELI